MTNETGSAGRFGVDQKAVFNLCEALALTPTAQGEGFAPSIVDPYLEIETTCPTTNRVLKSPDRWNLDLHLVWPYGNRTHQQYVVSIF
ncbi:hypothetical protein [Methylobacterium sp. WL8]|uniref:hypothetical protein n=1 Tax=Methylobacterium sp. WL8 TaxID=2603899 RepID=UPI0011CBAA14|nr:hypothetical protein [Methylobacterium sp. WL8]TXN82683.1 hypothetical protein FV234_09065 [Methylobacterium sp. WL8]